MKEVRRQKVQAENWLTPPISLTAHESIREHVNGSLKDDCRSVDVAILEHMVVPISPFEDRKENLDPRSFKQDSLESNCARVDSCGWMCPRDGKKALKPRSCQMLLDKWLAKQRL
ncbi:hypothetical protein KP509_06G004800 [Ceratopteris richardii]|nr:hypothetical protein KP509_06G004800 [Ceratopteris richardii]